MYIPRFDYMFDTYIYADWHIICYN